MKLYVVTTFDKDSACPSVYKTLERANEVFERAIKSNLYLGETSKENMLLTETTI